MYCSDEVAEPLAEGLLHVQEGRKMDTMKKRGLRPTRERGRSTERCMQMLPSRVIASARFSGTGFPRFVCFQTHPHGAPLRRPEGGRGILARVYSV